MDHIKFVISSVSVPDCFIHFEYKKNGFRFF
jgi:hypothetical protein